MISAYNMNIQILNTDMLDFMEKVGIVARSLRIPDDTPFPDVIDSIAAWAVDERISQIHKQNLADALDAAYLEVARLNMKAEESE